MDPELSGRRKWAVPCHTVRRTILSLGRVKLESYVSQAGTACCSPSVLLGVFHAWQLPVLWRPAGESWTLIEAEEVVCSGAMPQSPAPPSLRSPGGREIVLCVPVIAELEAQQLLTHTYSFTQLQAWCHVPTRHAQLSAFETKHSPLCAQRVGNIVLFVTFNWAVWIWRLLYVDRIKVRAIINN